LIGVAVIAVLAVVVVATGGAGAGLVGCIAQSALTGAIQGAITGAISGALIGGAIGGITEGLKTGTWEGALKGALSGAIDGAADGFMMGAIGGAIFGGLNPKYCFVAGTYILTKQGYKVIEEIKAGDLVLSKDPETGLEAYKAVTDVYVTESTEVFELDLGDEKITTTRGHLFEVSNKGWLKADELEINDTLINVEGELVTIKNIVIKELEESVKTYNLNVENYHTYFVGKNRILCHNACKEVGTYEFKFKSGESYVGKGSRRRMMQSMRQKAKQIGQTVDDISFKQFTQCADDASAFMLEHIKMMEYGFGQEGTKLLNRIYSPGRKLLMRLV